MSLWFVISLFKKRNDVADIAWGLGFIILTWLSFWVRDFDSGLRGILVASLIAIWGTRLAYHIYNRNKSKTEDYRYKAWRDTWGKWFYPRSYLQVYILQGILLFIIVLPVLVINNNFGPALGLLDVFGLFIWVLGFYFESVGESISLR